MLPASLEVEIVADMLLLGIVADTILWLGLGLPLGLSWSSVALSLGFTCIVLSSVAEARAVCGLYDAPLVYQPEGQCHYVHVSRVQLCVRLACYCLCPYPYPRLHLQPCTPMAAHDFPQRPPPGPGPMHARPGPAHNLALALCMHDLALHITWPCT